MFCYFPFLIAFDKCPAVAAALVLLRVRLLRQRRTAFGVACCVYFVLVSNLLIYFIPVRILCLVFRWSIAFIAIFHKCLLWVFPQDNAQLLATKSVLFG